MCRCSSALTSIFRTAVVSVFVTRRVYGNVLGRNELTLSLHKVDVWSTLQGIDWNPRVRKRPWIAQRSRPGKLIPPEHSFFRIGGATSIMSPWYHPKVLRNDCIGHLCRQAVVHCVAAHGIRRRALRDTRSIRMQSFASFIVRLGNCSGHIRSSQFPLVFVVSHCQGLHRRRRRLGRFHDISREGQARGLEAHRAARAGELGQCRLAYAAAIRLGMLHCVPSGSVLQDIP